MSLFKRKNKVVEINDKTELEKAFEEKGQKVGVETGKFVQKSVNKINKLREKYDSDEKIDKVKVFADETGQKVENLVEKASKRGKEAISNVKKK